VNFRTVFSSFLLAAVLLPAAASQTRKLTPKELPPSAFKLISLKVTGTSRYTQDEILPAAGLALGQTVGEDDFKKAAQQLGDSGVFTNVVFTYQYSLEGTKLEFQLTDNPKLLPVHFENFVWFSDQQLRDQLRQRVPLFKGELPIAGTLADKVSDALQAMLLERNLEGRADYLRSSDQFDGPITSFEFSVTGHPIHIAHVNFPGATAAELQELQAAAQKLTGQEYERSFVKQRALGNFLPIYQEHGYLKAAFEDPQPKVIQDSAAETTVDVTLPVKPGEQYKVTGMEIAGNQAFDAAKLRELLHLAPGRVADLLELNRNIDAMKDLCGTRGYMAARIDPQPQFDDAHAGVNFVLQIHEGDVYKMGDLDIRGLDSRTTARLQVDWRLRGGDPYDASYLKRFLKDAAPDYEPIGPWRITPHVSVEDKDKTVDVSLRFDPIDR
jgi:outer membrane protein assembly factor BamA